MLLPPLQGLDFDGEDWRKTVKNAVTATQEAFGDRLPVTALVDKKTFRSQKKCVNLLLFFVSFMALKALIFIFNCRTLLLGLLRDELHINVIFSATELRLPPAQESARMGE